LVVEVEGVVVAAGVELLLDELVEELGQVGPLGLFFW
jgi:hypothetical protein